MPANVVIREAPAEVVEQAQKILESHHEHLLEARILFLFSNAKSSSRGHVLLGKSKKLTPEQRYLSSAMRHFQRDEASVEAGYDFAVVVSQTQWSSLLATQREALLDHLLCFCDRKERINRRTGSVSFSWAIRGPDVEEFSEVVARHGLWRPQIRQFVQGADVTKQLPLPPDAVIEVKVPAERKTVVDESGVVIETRLEEGLPVVPAGDAEASAAPSTSPSEAPVFKPYEERSSEELAAGRPDGDWYEEIADVDSRDGGDATVPPEDLPDGMDPYPAVEDARSVPEIIADLDRRDEELERKQAEASIPGSWREVTGVGKTARRRS